MKPSNKQSSPLNLTVEVVNNEEPLPSQSFFMVAGLTGYTSQQLTNLRSDIAICLADVQAEKIELIPPGYRSDLKLLVTTVRQDNDYDTCMKIKKLLGNFLRKHPASAE